MSTLVSRNVTVDGHRTSIRLEPDMWEALEEICRRRGISAHQFCSEVEQTRAASSLTAAVRVAVLRYFRDAAGARSNDNPAGELGRRATA